MEKSYLMEDPFEDSGSEWNVSDNDVLSSSSLSNSSPLQLNALKKRKKNIDRVKKDIFGKTVNAIIESLDTDGRNSPELSNAAAVTDEDYFYERIDCSNDVEEAVHSEVNLDSFPTVCDSNTIDHTIGNDVTESEQTSQLESEPISGQEFKANILIKHSTAILTVSKSLHSGLYTLLFDELDKPEEKDTNCFNLLNNEIVSFIIADINPSQHHICKFDDKSTPCYISIGDGKIINVNVRWCLSPGELKGALAPTGDRIIGALLYTKMDSSCGIKNPKLKTKAHCCVFCSKFVTALPRHLLNKHLDEDEVKTVDKLPLKSLERIKLLKELRVRGDNLYNAKCCSKDRITVRKLTKISVEDTVPCPNCKSLFAPKSLYKHHQKCVNRPKNKLGILKEARQLARSSSAASQSSSNSNSGINQVGHSNLNDVLLDQLLEPLKNDEVGKTIRNDRTILLLAKRLAMKHRASPHNYRNCRQELRLAARVFIEVRKLDSTIQHVQDFLDTTHYLTIMNAVNSICYGDDYTFRIPTVVSSLRLVIKNLTNALISDFRMKGLLPTDPLLVRLFDFKNFHETEFIIRVGKTAYISSQRNRMFKSRDLPAIDDIGKLTTYLQTEAEKCYQILQKEYSYNSWVRLGSLVLHQVVLFNRRRPGEVSRILLRSFNERRMISKEDHDKMTRMEVLLAERFILLRLIGKRGRVLPALLTKQQVEYLELFTSLRSTSGVSESNEYLFCGRNTSGHLEAGGRALTSYAAACGANDPKLLRCTRLRKQVATVSQFLILNENEIQQLADFMGHDISVHRANYRQPELQREITVLSRFFMAAGGSCDITKFKGKSINELEILLESEPTKEDTDDEVEDMVDMFLGQSSCNSNVLENPESTSVEDNFVECVSTAFRPNHTSTPEKSTSLSIESHKISDINIKKVPRVQLRRIGETVSAQRSPIQTRATKLIKSPRKLEAVQKKSPKKRRQSINEIIQELRSPPKLKFTRKNKPKRKYTRKEVQLLLVTFEKEIRTARMPSKQEFQNLIDKYRTEFFDRTPQHLYSFMQYRFKIFMKKKN